jgi:hypothetical protein
MRGGKRNGAGRKPVHIDLVELEKLCSIQCTDEDLAGFFKVTTRTIENKRKIPQFAEAMARGRANGRISVRRAQFKLLKKGDPGTAKWLGKQYLGQRDITPIELTGAKGKPIELTLEVLDAIVALKQKN